MIGHALLLEEAAILLSYQQRPSKASRKLLALLAIRSMLMHNEWLRIVYFALLIRFHRGWPHHIPEEQAYRLRRHAWPLDPSQLSPGTCFNGAKHTTWLGSHFNHRSKAFTILFISFLLIRGSCTTHWEAMLRIVPQQAAFVLMRIPHAACYSIYEFMGSTALSQVKRSSSGVWRYRYTFSLVFSSLLSFLSFLGYWGHQSVRTDHS